MKVCEIASQFGVSRRRHQFACLNYHIIGSGASQYTLSEEQLRAHVALLKAEGYVIDDFEGLEAMLHLRRSFPRRYVVLTVDDGHESSMQAADILEAHGGKATFFVTRDRALKERGFIRGQEIRGLRERGFSLGTHGTTHRKLTFMSKQACIEELRGSKQWLEDVIGEEIRYSAAPGGYINWLILQLAAACGYFLTGTCREWMNSPETMVLPGIVNRVNVRQHFSLRLFRQAVEGHPGFYAWRRLRAAALVVPKLLLR
jgi:peptidoglycan/xylan/chitin deacetylase (PgdA/CDA1 family)